MGESVVSQGSLLTLLYLQRNNFLLAKMSAFEDEFEAIPPVSEVDPAAEFLAKEQEELGDIGEDLGLGAAHQDFSAAADENFGGNNEDENALFSASQSGLIPVDNNANDADVNPFLQDPIQMQETPVPVVTEGKDIYAGMQNLSINKAQEEPVFITKWKEEQQERLRKKDEEEATAMDELKEKAKKELEDWYKRYETQLEKTKSSNREEETKYETNELNGIEPGSEWERVAKHCDFSAKAPGHTKDVSRMRTIMLQLKQNQPVKA